MDNKIVALIVSILLPPLAVYLKKGAGSDLVINIVLCLLMWLPGVLHAIWLTVLSCATTYPSRSILNSYCLRSSQPAT